VVVTGDDGVNGQSSCSARPQLVERRHHEREQGVRPVLVMPVEPLKVDHTDRPVNQALAQDVEQAGLADLAQAGDQDVLVAPQRAADRVQQQIAAEQEALVDQRILRVEQVVAVAVVAFEFGEESGHALVGVRGAQ
jgi:hypothetical protein